MNSNLADKLFWGMLVTVLVIIVYLSVVKIEKLEPRRPLIHPTPTGTVFP